MTITDSTGIHQLFATSKNPKPNFKKLDSYFDSVASGQVSEKNAGT